MHILSDKMIDEALKYNQGRHELDNSDAINAMRIHFSLSADGSIDKGFVLAVAQWQLNQGLIVDGKLGPITHGSIIRSIANDIPIKHPLPPIVKRWGYDHAELTKFPYKDIQLELATSNGTWGSGMIRLVSGYSTSRKTFNRGLDSFITLDTYSLGIAHWWAESAPELLSELATKEPEIASWAWGDKVAILLQDEDWLLEIIPPKRGKKQYDDSLAWLLAGWWACARHPRVVRIQVETWFQEYINRALNVANSMHWTDHLASDIGGKILAALTRAANSGKGARHIRKFDSGGSPLDTLKKFYNTGRDNGGYGKPDRWKKISTWTNFTGPAPVGLDEMVNGVDVNTEPLRHNGDKLIFPTDL